MFTKLWQEMCSIAKHTFYSVAMVAKLLNPLFTVLLWLPKWIRSQMPPFIGIPIILWYFNAVRMALGSCLAEFQSLENKRIWTFQSFSLFLESLVKTKKECHFLFTPVVPKRQNKPLWIEGEVKNLLFFFHFFKHLRSTTVYFNKYLDAF